MKYIELSKKLHLIDKTSDEDLKRALLQRLQRAFRVERVQEFPNGFHIGATTGGRRGLVRNVRADLDVSISRKGDKAGIVAHGHSKVAQSLLWVYTVLFVMIMVVGLLPGFVATDDTSTAADALVFLIFGIFIFYDIDNKLDEPKRNVQAALDSLEVEFG
jgi:hypothetical protein